MSKGLSGRIAALRGHKSAVEATTSPTPAADAAATLVDHGVEAPTSDDAAVVASNTQPPITEAFTEAPTGPETRPAQAVDGADPVEDGSPEPTPATLDEVGAEAGDVAPQTPMVQAAAAQVLAAQVLAAQVAASTTRTRRRFGSTRVVPRAAPVVPPPSAQADAQDDQVRATEASASTDVPAFDEPTTVEPTSTVASIDDHDPPADEASPQVELSDPDLAETEPVAAEPSKARPTQGEPVQTEVAETEPAVDEPAVDDAGTDADARATEAHAPSLTHEAAGESESDSSADLDEPAPEAAPVSEPMEVETPEAADLPESAPAAETTVPADDGPVDPPDAAVAPAPERSADDAADQGDNAADGTGQPSTDDEITEAENEKFDNSDVKDAAWASAFAAADAHSAEDTARAAVEAPNDGSPAPVSASPSTAEDTGADESWSPATQYGRPTDHPASTGGDQGDVVSGPTGPEQGDPGAGDPVAGDPAAGDPGAGGGAGAAVSGAAVSGVAGPRGAASGGTGSTGTGSTGTGSTGTGSGGTGSGGERSGAAFGTDPASAEQQRRRSTTVLAGAAAVAAVVILVVVLAIVLGNSSDHKSAKQPDVTTAVTSAPLLTSASSPTATPSPVKSPSTGPEVPAQTALARWATANLSKKTIIAADAASATTLASAGFTSVVSDNATNVDWHTVAFLIRNRNLGHSSTLRTELANASAPLALFGTGSQEITVSQVYPNLGSDLSAAVAHDLAIRKQAGGQLLENPNIKFSAAAKKSVQAGRLDMRAAAVLVLLAKSTPVYVIDVVDDPAEARASRPSRTIVISTSNLNMVQQTLSSVGLDYRPAHVQVIDQNAVQMQWIPAIVPVAGG